MRDALVLRSYLPVYNRAILLDRDAGRMHVTLRNYRTQHALIQGTLVSYESIGWRGKDILQEYSMQQFPVEKVRNDINFLHQVMTILLQGTAEKDYTSGLYTHCEDLFCEDLISQVEYTLFKQLFLCKLFALLSIYPDESVFHKSSDIRRLILYPLATMVKMADTIASEELSIWLFGCVHGHPHIYMSYQV